MAKGKTVFIKDKQKQRMLLATLLICNFTTMMNMSSVNIGLPSFMREFDIGITLAQWILVGYLLTLAMSMPLVGYFVEKYTPRRLYNIALIVMGSASLVCTIAPALWVLVLGRMVQGAAAGLIVPQTMSLIYRYIPRQKQSDYLGYSMMVGALGPAFGPTIGGFLITAFSWRAVFLVNLPLIGLAYAYSLKSIPAEEPDSDSSLDVFGIAVLALGTGLLLFGFTMLETWGAHDVKFIGCISIGALMIAYFIRRELRSHDPLLNFRVLESTPFSLSVIINCTMSLTLTITPILMAVYLQEVLGNSAFEAGLILLPPALIMVLSNEIARMLTHHVRAKYILMVALSICALGNFLLGQSGMETPVMIIVVYLALRYLGLGMVNMPLVNYGMRNVPPEQATHAASLLNWCKQIVVVISVNFFSVILALKSNRYFHNLGDSSTYGWKVSQVYAVQDMFGYLSVILIVCVGMTLLMRKKDDPSPREQVQKKSSV